MALSTVFDTNYKTLASVPNLKYKVSNDVRNFMNVRTGPSTSFNSIGKVTKADPPFTATKRVNYPDTASGKGVWLFSPDLKGWICLVDKTGNEIYLRWATDADILESTGEIPEESVDPEEQKRKNESDAANQTNANANAYETKITLNLNANGLPELLAASGIYTADRANWHVGYSKTGFLDMWSNITNTREYVFFTRPDLNLFTGASGSIGESTLNSSIVNSSQFLVEMAKKNPLILAALDQRRGEIKGPFIPLLFNMVRNTVDMPSISSKDEESPGTQYGARVYFRGHAYDSNFNHDFSLEFMENKYTEVYNFFKSMDEYNTLKRLGLVKPQTKYAPSFDFGKTGQNGRRLYDQMAIYKIVTSEDGETILFYGKLTGVYAKGAPRESFSEVSGPITHSVQFKSSFIRDNNPLILAEFNTQVASSLSSGATSHTLPAGYEIMPNWNAKYNVVNAEWAAIPFIVIDYKLNKNRGVNYVYKLKWAKKKS